MKKVFVCPNCGEEMDCPPGDFVGGLVKVEASCKCGNRISGFIGLYDEKLCIFDVEAKIPLIVAGER
jgi:hypothetical protein